MVPFIRRAATALASCAWLDAGRARAYARILLGVTLIGALGWIALSAGGVDREGKPIGTDFVGFYTASRLALDGAPERAYDVGAHWAAQKALFGPKLGYTAFFYPPPALLISLPLALAPYFWSLAAWLAATGYAFYRVLRGYLPSLDPVAFLAFPAVFVNAAHGQNGFLSAALIGGGLLAMDASPALAGVLFGAMAFKPHLALVIPIALVFSRRWTTLIAGAATAAAFSAASLAAFGAPTWQGFFADLFVRPLGAGEQSCRRRENAERVRRGSAHARVAGARLGSADRGGALRPRRALAARGPCVSGGGGTRRDRLRRLAREPIPARLRSDPDRDPARLAVA